MFFHQGGIQEVKVQLNVGYCKYVGVLSNWINSLTYVDSRYDALGFYTAQYGMFVTTFQKDILPPSLGCLTWVFVTLTFLYIEHILPSQSFLHPPDQIQSACEYGSKMFPWNIRANRPSHIVQKSRRLSFQQPPWIPENICALNIVNLPCNWYIYIYICAHTRLLPTNCMCPWTETHSYMFHQLCTAICRRHQYTAYSRIESAPFLQFQRAKKSDVD